MNKLTKAGIVAYVLWGILHLALPASMITKHVMSGRQAMLADLGALADPGPGVGNALLQHMFNIGLFGALSIVVALTLIKRGDAFGVWLNFWLLGAADVVFVWLLVVPGYVPLERGFLGPLLFVIAAATSVLGLQSGQKAQLAAAHR